MLKMLNKYPIFGLVMLLGIVSILVGLHFVKENLNFDSEDHMESNKCLMSWMQWNYFDTGFKMQPQAAINGGNENDTIPAVEEEIYIRERIKYHPSMEKYKVYLYREGKNINPTRAKRLRGIPLLFVPGNRGSYMQGRSLGVGTHIHDGDLPPFKHAFVEEMRRLLGWKGNKYTREIELFTVDFDEEWSGLSSKILFDQTFAVNEIIKYILNDLYDATDIKEVITVGHSMGGMVLRMAPLLKNYQKGSISTILTLSTPHRYIPFLFDPLMIDVYTQINSEWKNNQDNEESDIPNISVISIGSGFRDTLIPSDATRLDGIVKNSISVSAYEIPYVRVSVDHLSAAWCKQLIQVVASTMLTLINHPENPEKGYALSLDTRMDIFKYFLISDIQQVLQLPTRDSFKSEFYEPLSTAFWVSNVANVFRKMNPIPPSVYANKPYVTFSKTNLLKKKSVYALNLHNFLDHHHADSIYIASSNLVKDVLIYAQENDQSQNLTLIEGLAKMVPYVRAQEGHAEIQYYPQNVVKHFYLIQKSQLAKVKNLIFKFEDRDQITTVSAVNMTTTRNSKALDGFSWRNFWKKITFNAEHQQPLVLMQMNEYSTKFPYQLDIDREWINQCGHDVKDAMQPVVFHRTIQSERMIEHKAHSFVLKEELPLSEMNTTDWGFDVMYMLDPRCSNQKLPFRVSIQFSFVEYLTNILHYIAPPTLLPFVTFWIVLAIIAEMYTKSDEGLLWGGLAFYFKSFFGMPILGIHVVAGVSYFIFAALYAYEIQSQSRIKIISYVPNFAVSEYFFFQMISLIVTGVLIGALSIILDVFKYLIFMIPSYIVRSVISLSTMRYLFMNLLLPGIIGISLYTPTGIATIVLVVLLFFMITFYPSCASLKTFFIFLILHTISMAPDCVTFIEECVKHQRIILEPFHLYSLFTITPSLCYLYFYLTNRVYQRGEESENNTNEWNLMKTISILVTLFQVISYLVIAYAYAGSILPFVNLWVSVLFVINS